MPENLGYQFDRLYAAPIETYRQVNTITNRNAIPPEIRWEGMECYVITENQDYQLVGGVDNSNWVNAGETVSNPTTHFKGFFNATTLTPAINNINGIEGDEYKVTNGGVNVDFGAGNIFLETDDILIFYQSQWRVKVRVGGNLDDYQLLSEKGSANGYTPLDSGAKVPIEFLPDSLVGQVTYQGAWNASTNTPNVGDATTKKGHYYVTSVAGTYLGVSYEVGDWIISNGATWQKVDNTDAVVSVFGRIGPIVANAGDYAAFYEPIFSKNTGFNKNFGTTAGTVSEGNHTHTFASLTSKPTTIGGYGITDFNSLGDARWFSQRIEYAGNINTISVSSHYTLLSGATNVPSGQTALGSSLIHYQWNADAAKQVFYATATDNSYWRRKSAGLWGAWQKYWTDTNDGTGSGLDADLLRGVHWGNVNTNIITSGTVTATNFILSSDERLKNNIKPIGDIWREFEMDGVKRYGVIAQEIEKSNPELVHTNEEGYKSVAYIDLICKEMAEKDKKIQELESRLEKLEKHLKL